MAHILRLRLHALCSSRLPSIATASKLLTSPDQRLTTWRWYGEGALLEDPCNSSNELDGVSMATNQEVILVKESEGMGSGTLKKEPATPSMNSFNFEDCIESSLGKLTSLVSEQNEANVNITHDEKGSTDQSQFNHPATEESNKSAKDAKWQQLVNNLHPLAMKKKGKAGDADNSGSLKAGQLESQNLESRPARGQQFGVSEGSSVSSREPLLSSVFSKNLKQKNVQSQCSNQQRNTQSQSSNQQKMSQSFNQQKNTPSQSSNQQKSRNSKPPLSFEYLQSLDLQDALKELDDELNDEQDNQSKNDPKMRSDNDPKNPSDKLLDAFSDNDTKKSSDILLDKTTSEDLDNWSSAMNSLDQLETSKSTTLPFFSGGKSKDGGLQYKNPQSSQGRESNLRGKDSSFSRAPQDNNIQDRNQQAKGRNDASNTTRGRILSGTREATYQPSSNGDVASQKVHMVCVQNLPPTCNPSTVRASMAIHGEVTGFFKKPVWNDKLNVYVQFKTAEAMENALAARKLQVANRTCFIMKADHSVFSSVVRISKVHLDTDECQLRAVCAKYGKVDDVKKRALGVYDVFYDMKELGNITSIITSLNEVKLHRHTWFALPAPVLHPSVEKEVLKSPEGQSWHEIHVNQAINRIETGLDMVSVLFEDLKELTVAAREYSK